MKRISRITIGRLSPRATVLTGAALGLCAGVPVYGAVSSAAESPAAFKAIAVAKAPATAPLRYANCAAGAKLENGFCVTHVVKTVLAAPVARAVPTATAQPASTAKAVPAVKVRTATAATPTSATAAPVAPSAKPTATPSEDAAPAPGATSTASPAPTPVPSAAS